MSETPTIPANVKEKIVICLDLTEDEDESPLGVGDQSFSVDTVLRQAVQQFIRLKSSLSGDTEFALVGMLNSKAKWINEFSRDISNTDVGIFPTNKTSKPVEVNLDEIVFPILEENLQTHLPTLSPDGLPSHVCQVIFIYKSSLRTPNVNNVDFNMFKSPGVIFDVVYLHDIPSEENKVDIIFQNLSKLNVTGNSYLLELLNNQVTTIYNTISLLLAHPLQRPPQKYLNNDLKFILSDRKEEETACNGD